MKVKLTNSPVEFREQEHEYWLNGKQLHGITGMINQYIFPDKYKTDNKKAQEAIEAKREYGHLVHKQLENYVNKCNRKAKRVEYLKTCEQVVYDGLQVLEDNGITPLVGEYLVSDNDFFATCIDLVSTNFDLVDYKTYKAENEYLRWQLSICAELFELQTGHKAGNLYGLILESEGVKLVKVERMKKEYVAQMMYAFSHGYTCFDNPLNTLGKEEEELMMEYLSVHMEKTSFESALEAPKKQKKAIDAEYKSISSKLKEATAVEDELRQRIIACMREVDTYGVKSQAYTISREPDKVSMVFDEEAFKADNPKLYQRYLKEVRKDGTLRITTKV